MQPRRPLGYSLREGYYLLSHRHHRPLRPPLRHQCLQHPPRRLPHKPLVLLPASRPRRARDLQLPLLPSLSLLGRRQLDRQLYRLLRPRPNRQLLPHVAILQAQLWPHLPPLRHPHRHTPPPQLHSSLLPVHPLRHHTRSRSLHPHRCSHSSPSLRGDSLVGGTRSRPAEGVFLQHQLPSTAYMLAMLHYHTGADSGLTLPAIGEPIYLVYQELVHLIYQDIGA